MTQQRRRGRCCVGSGAGPGGQLVEIDRLDQVVVGSGIEAADLVAGRVARRQDEDGRVWPATAQTLQDGHAIDPGQAEVEDEQVEILALQREVGEMAVFQPVDRETGLAQADGQAIAELGVVFTSRIRMGKFYQRAR